MAVIKSSIEFVTLDKEWKITYKAKQPMRSWVLGLFQVWYPCLGFNSNTLAGITDVNGNAHNLNNGTQGLMNLMVGAPGGRTVCFSVDKLLSRGTGDRGEPPCGGALHDTLRVGYDIGIIVGSDNTAVTPTDTKLNTRINHGNAAGQLEYGGCEVLEPSFANPNGSMLIRRYFTNDSGGNVTVQECGIYSFGYQDTSHIYNYCIARDVVNPAVVVADTEILVATYTVGITV